MAAAFSGRNSVACSAGSAVDSVHSDDSIGEYCAEASIDDPWPTTRDGGGNISASSDPAASGGAQGNRTCELSVGHQPGDSATPHGKPLPVRARSSSAACVFLISAIRRSSCAVNSARLAWCCAARARPLRRRPRLPGRRRRCGVRVWVWEDTLRPRPAVRAGAALSRRYATSNTSPHTASGGALPNPPPRMSASAAALDLRPASPVPPPRMDTRRAPAVVPSSWPRTRPRVRAARRVWVGAAIAGCQHRHCTRCAYERIMSSTRPPDGSLMDLHRLGFEGNKTHSFSLPTQRVRGRGGRLPAARRSSCWNHAPAGTQLGTWRPSGPRWPRGPNHGKGGVGSAAVCYNTFPYDLSTRQPSIQCTKRTHSWRGGAANRFRRARRLNFANLCGHAQRIKVTRDTRARSGQSTSVWRCVHCTVWLV